MSDASLFAGEERILAHADRVLAEHEDDDTPLTNEYRTIVRGYTKLLKQLKKLIRVSDHREQKMNMLNETLRAEISERERAEAFLKRYDFIVNTSLDFMTLINREYRYDAVNHAYCDAHGMRVSDVIGKTVGEVWGEEIFQNELKARFDACFAGEALEYQEWFISGKHGKTFMIVSYYPFYTEGEVSHAVVISRDYTANRVAEEKTLALNNKLLQELAIASTLQQSITAPERIEYDTYTIRSTYIPCDEMGGDYLNVIPRADSIYMISADVSGHGLVASFYSFILDSILQTLLVTSVPIDALMRAIQKDIRKYLAETNVFITLRIMLIHPNENRLTFVDAGHPPFLVYGKNGVKRYFTKSLFMNSLVEYNDWVVEEVALDEGDRVILFTDGLFEITGKDDAIIDLGRIEDIVAANKECDAKAMLATLVEEVNALNKEDSFDDDISVCIYEKKHK